MFHEETFRSDFSRSTLPPYLILAIVASTLRYSHDPCYKDNLSLASNQFAAQAWRAILAECFESESGPDYRTVQGTILLAVHQFVGCNYRSAWIRIGMAISIAQSLNLMSEPPDLAISTREEHRRTLWSIYMLDRLGTCGTNRTGLFPDSALRLRLPCPENTFRDGSPNDSPTLKLLNESPPDQLGNVGAFARVILLTSTLSRIAGFSLQQNWQAQMEPPSTQNSEYAQLITRLRSLSTYFDKRQPFDPTNWSSGGREDSNDIALCIFSHILYHLCYCILQHPFVLKRRHRPGDAPFAGDFLSDSLQKNWQNAQDLTHTLSYATQKNMPTWSSFYAYCSLVAGTINCLHCLSKDENTQNMSKLAVQMNFLYLERQAKLYANSAQMLAALRKFEKDAEALQHLVDPGDQEHILDEDDAGRLYRLLDYSAQSTRATSEDLSRPGTELPLLSPSSLDALDLFDLNFTSFDNFTPGMFIGESTQWNLD
ncbi:Fungal specific transcription factor domain-containing protein isoform 2 [Cladophialophora immunda]|nr:Fungal specific transcription factor domain-containing protein isoform 2 [Cladophialophora immunda]